MACMCALGSCVYMCVCVCVCVCEREGLYRCRHALHRRTVEIAPYERVEKPQYPDTLEQDERVADGRQRPVGQVSRAPRWMGGRAAPIVHGVFGSEKQVGESAGARMESGMLGSL